jgi:hypothetical protein
MKMILDRPFLKKYKLAVKYEIKLIFDTTKGGWSEFPYLAGLTEAISKAASIPADHVKIDHFYHDDKSHQFMVAISALANQDEMISSRPTPTPCRTIALIGSARFKERFFELEKELTVKGFYVLMPYIDGLLHKEAYSEEQWECLMMQAFRRVELADIILVVDVNKYIGSNTRREIEHATDLGKKILYLENGNVDDLDIVIENA